MGSFLFQRILQDGKDSRFEEIKKSPARFAGAFTAQATWVSLCLMPIIAVNSIPASALAATGALKLTDVLGLSLYAGGLLFEVIADRQKSQWAKERREKVHDEEFLTRGLWSVRLVAPVPSIPIFLLILPRWESQFLASSENVEMRVSEKSE